MSIAGLAKQIRIGYMGAALLLVVLFGSAARADWFNFSSPVLPYISFPELEGEIRTRASWMTITSGNVSTQNPQERAVQNYGGLRDHFQMTSDNLFMDLMIRAQLGRFGLRVNYEPRDFVGNRNNPNLFSSEARLNYSGVRVGFDVDALKWGLTRFGVDLDYDCFQPTFTYPTSFRLVGRNILTGLNAFTLGIHGCLNPVTTCYGVQGIAEFRARWPVSGAEVVDWEVSTGLKTPDTLIGSWALKLGYHGTQLQFGDGPVKAKFDCTFSGWFADVSFYY
jgi:hypothetical protein